MRTITTNDAPPTALRGIADHSWHKRGRCHGIPGKKADELFFPTPRAHTAIAEAKSLCGRCPVKKECFNYALDNDLYTGLWGGLTEKERRRWHAKVAKRLDYSRVRAVLQGRDVHLSVPERDTVIRHAYLRGWSPERLAYLLKTDLDWIRDLLREAGHAIADRDRYDGLYDAGESTDDEPDDEATEEEDEAPSPVPAQAHTHALIAALRKAA
jgi:WhiB family redox-sensing transcriptional regulator